jgi:hypothetical protein
MDAAGVARDVTRVSAAMIVNGAAEKGLLRLRKDNGIRLRDIAGVLLQFKLMLRTYPATRRQPSGHVGSDQVLG